jgi:hypothetical protein
VRPNYHFYNVPVSATHSETSVSPNRFIKDIALPQDFVAYKLDIDTMEVEVPLALELLSDPHLIGLVDEFFFELHFQCDIMKHCGWGDKIPAEHAGLKLDRYSAMDFFRKLRVAGVRAHIWP